MEPQQVLPFRVRVDLGVMVLRRYFTLLKSLELELHHQMQYRVIPRTLPFVGRGSLEGIAKSLR